MKRWEGGGITAPSDGFCYFAALFGDKGAPTGSRRPGHLPALEVPEPSGRTPEDQVAVPVTVEVRESRRREAEGLDR